MLMLSNKCDEKLLKIRNAAIRNKKMFLFISLVIEKV